MSAWLFMIHDALTKDPSLQIFVFC